MIRRKKNVKKGIQFCLMVCGASGTGEFDLHHHSAPRPPPLLCKAIDFVLTASIHHSTGRTTFVNTLCGKTVLGHKDSDDPSGAHVEDGVKIKPYTVGTHELPRHSISIQIPTQLISDWLAV